MSNKANITIKGDTIGPWKLGETLGLGSTGKVQLAFNETTNQHAAIKIISKSIFNNTANTKSNPNTSMVSSTPDSLPYGIEREIIIMKLLNHPNILRLYDVWETNNNLYMVLEYAEKGELFNLLVERGPLPENEAVRFFRQIIIGMSYCHALGIVHRDLKPENILLDHKLNIKIADFGMAALETEDKLLETSCGSPHYAAPEIVSGLPYHGLETDVWSCGVILYALLTGRLPFDEEDGNIRNLLLKVQKGEFEMPGDDEVSREAQDLLTKILTVDPKLRIKTREILKHPLLQKYPSIKDSKTIRNLPKEDTYLNPLSDQNGKGAAIDKSILQNLVVLWHGRDANELVAKLKEPGANAEKTLYALLHRFKFETEKENFRSSQIRKRHSVISSKPNTSTASNQNSSPQRRRNRMSLISVSSHKRPISFNKLPAVVSNKDIVSISSSSNTTPNSSKRISMSLSSNKRSSKLFSHSNSASPSPAPRSRRLSTQNLDKPNITPPIPVDMLKDYNILTDPVRPPPLSKRASRLSKRLSVLPNLNRGSITTKLISTYAKLAEEDDWEFIEKETKRVSSDFATLIDEIFEHEKYEQIRIEKKELERKVKETKERERRREEEEATRKILELEALEKQEQEIQKQSDEDLIKFENEDDQTNIENEEDETLQNRRSVSAPVESEVVIEEQGNVSSNKRNFSLQTRPVSRLDPGIFYSAPEVMKEEEENLSNQKVILETIRRSKFLGSSFDINKEFESAKEEAKKKRKQQLKKLEEEEKEQNCFTTGSGYETLVLPKNATGIATLNDYNEPMELRKISEVKVPHFTRKSKHFSESNKRMSVLSMYSSKQSFTNLVDILREDGIYIDSKGNEDQNETNEPEFMFESVDEEILETTQINSEAKFYDISDNAEEINKPNNMKLNFADRFNKAENNTYGVDVNLPSLPPLTTTNALGIYQNKENKPNKINVESQNSNNKIEETQNKKSFNEERHPLNKTREVSLKSETIPAKKDLTSNDKKRNNSFFRKFSKSSTPVVSNSYDSKLYATVSAKQLFNGLNNLLRGWSKYGLKDVVSFEDTMTITGRLSGENILSLRSTLIEIVVYTEDEFGVIAFRKKSGSTKTMKRLAGEIENVLNKEGVLQK